MTSAEQRRSNSAQGSPQKFIRATVAALITGAGGVPSVSRVLLLSHRIKTKAPWKSHGEARAGAVPDGMFARSVRPKLS